MSGGRGVIENDRKKNWEYDDARERKKKRERERERELRDAEKTSTKATVLAGRGESTTEHDLSATDI